MIAIINISGNPLGECQYELRINKRVITTFKHNRTEGLSVCLKKASIAAEKAKWEDAINLMDEINHITNRST